MSQPRVSTRPPLPLVPLLVLLAASACAFPGSGPAPLMTFNEAALKKGQGAVMLHVVDQGSLLATRWLKLDDPGKRQSFTVYRSDRHRSLDRRDVYDLVAVEPGTYALYSVFGNCDEGLRPGSTDWDEPWQDGVVSPLGQVSRVKSYKPGGGATTGGVGIWGGGGGNFGIGLGLGLSAPGEPVAICNLRTPGVKDGQAMLATVTVKAGELVYAGELEFAFGADSRCEASGNWLTSNETRQYCGADWARLDVTDLFSAKAFPFIEKTLGPEAANKAVVRLARPGSFVTTR